MNERERQVRAFYQARRIDDQLRYYRSRRDQFDRATGQSLAISASLFGLSSAVSALAGAKTGWVALWATLATLLPAVSTGLAAYTALYAFDKQSKLFGDAIRGVQAAARDSADGTGGGVAELVERVEGAFRQEQAQWGQLTTPTEIAHDTKE